GILMKKYDNSVEKFAKNALLSCLSRVPFLKVIEVQDISNEKYDQQFDIKAKIRLPDGVMNLIAEVKSSGQPRLARESVNQMLRYKDKFPDAYFVFIAPYISSRAAEICESQSVGYLDLSGNCLLSFDKIFIQKTDYPNQFKEKRNLKSLYAPKAERILRVLLCNPGKKWKIKELADESAVSLGQVSNVKRVLFDRELISGKRGEFSLNDPPSLLREWAENYDYRRNKVQELYSLKSVTDVENTLATYCNSRKIKYALTGFSGAARIEPAVRYKKAMVYVADLSEEALSEISVKPVKSGGNLLIFIPYDDGVFYGSIKVNEIQVASEVQLYLDLQGYRGRGEEAAEVLYERIVEKSW
ncbi:MAG: type IV toxin-antitoxin system AbiEi family antitoxin, partial [Desulfobacterales bacterium]